jgi:hypothetical protein
LHDGASGIGVADDVEGGAGLSDDHGMIPVTLETDGVAAVGTSEIDGA